MYMLYWIWSWDPRYLHKLVSGDSMIWNDVSIWRRHYNETFPALQASCQYCGALMKPKTLLNKHLICPWFAVPHGRSCDVTVMNQHELRSCDNTIGLHPDRKTYQQLTWNDMIRTIRGIFAIGGGPVHIPNVEDVHRSRLLTTVQ